VSNTEQSIQLFRWVSLVLQICRLTDEAQTMGRKNLTVKFLVEHSEWSNAPGTLAKLKRISDSIHDFRKRLLPARRWFIARCGSTSRLAWRRMRMSIRIRTSI
jgi:hypothetical protein